jgi:hypothetical protein
MRAIVINAKDRTIIETDVDGSLKPRRFEFTLRIRRAVKFTQRFGSQPKPIAEAAGNFFETIVNAGN